MIFTHIALLCLAAVAKYTRMHFINSKNLFLTSPDTGKSNTKAVTDSVHVCWGIVCITFCFKTAA
jgi:hypothetical protein